METAGLPFVPDSAAVEATLQEYLDDLTAGYMPDERLTVSLTPPDADGVGECIESNRSVTAMLRLSAKGCDALDIPILYPYHGVFLRRSWNVSGGQNTEPRLYRWQPVLIPAMGIWGLRVWKGRTEPDGLKLRLGLSGGLALDAGSAKNGASDDDAPQGKPWFAPVSAVRSRCMDLADHPVSVHLSEVAGFFDNPEHVLLQESDRKTLRRMLGEAQTAISDLALADWWVDDQDLACQRLWTYGAFLSEWLARQIATVLYKEGKNGPASVLNQLRGAELSGRLLVTIGKNSNNKNDEEKFGLVPFNPLNGLAAASELTAFLRYRKTREQTPAHMRQNHPSFDGRICPVETPESKKVGLTLHVAAGATTDVRGKIQNEPSQGHGLGFAAATIPFFHHNDGARSMLGAKNAVQALPINAPEPPLIATGHEVDIAQALAPLGDVGLMRADSGFLSPGRNLLVAYMPWQGLNFQDAIVANRDLVGPMDYADVQHHSCFIPPGFRPCHKTLRSETVDNKKVVFTDLIDYVPDWIWGCFIEKRAVDTPEWVTPDTIIALFRSEGHDKRLAIRCGAEGRITQMTYHPPVSDCTGGMLEWTTRRDYALQVGDKLMGRHGNKGVISALLPASEMPRLPEDERLGELSGRAVDLVLNPNGVISRMNLGQLYETQLSFLMKLRGNDVLPAHTGAPFVTTDLEAARQALLEVNAGAETAVVDPWGKVYPVLPDGLTDGSTTRSPVVVGYQYFYRLKHIPETKGQARTGGRSASFDASTGQPLKGRKKGGGQRVGEMEMWALSAAQTDGVMTEFLTDKSDDTNPTGDHSQTFQAISDCLFAYGVKLEEEGGNYRLVSVPEEEIVGRAEPVTSGDSWITVSLSSFTCEEKKHKNGVPSVNGIVATGENDGTKQATLLISDVLKHHGVGSEAVEVKPAIPRNPPERRRRRTITVTFSGPVDAIQVFFTIWGSGRSVHIDFVIGGTRYHAYSDLGWPKDIARILGYAIACPEHTTTLLTCTDREPRTVAAPGGLCDPTIFGPGGDKWGYIETPDGLRSASSAGADTIPTHLPVLPLRQRQNDYWGNEKTLTRASLSDHYQKLFSAMSRFESAPVDKKLTQFKAVKNTLDAIRSVIDDRLWGKKGLLRQEGLGRRIDRSGRFVIVPDPSLAWDECALPLEGILALFQNEIASWADGNGVTVELKHQGLHDVLVAIWKRDWKEYIPPKARVTLSTIAKRFLNEIRPHLLVNRQPTLHRYNVKALRPVLTEVDMLDYLISDDTDSIWVMGVNPLICESMGADFDGDEMAVLCLPSGEDIAREAQFRVIGPPGNATASDGGHDHDWEDRLKDARQEIEVQVAHDVANLSPVAPANLLSVATGQPVAGFEQDFVLGHYLMSLQPDARRRFVDTVPVRTCIECQRLLELPEWPVDQGREFMVHLCKAHGEEAGTRITSWMRLAFEAATKSGTSFGIFELSECARHLQRCFDRPKGISASSVGHLESQNEIAYTNVAQHLRSVLESCDPIAPGYGFAALHLSGARGNDSQIRQTLGMRGFLSPGVAAFDVSPETFFFNASLLAGMARESAFLASMNARSSMVAKKLATASAGDLTRQLVFALWPWRVGAQDCGSTESPRSPGTCLLGAGAICATCYDNLTRGELAPTGYPAGLVAAQSIGERGTQLSMKVFHTGKAAVSVDDVLEALGGTAADEWKEAATADDGGATFVSLWRDAFDAYQDVDSRHLSLLWRALHDAPKHTLASAVSMTTSKDLFAGLAFGDQKRFVQRALNPGITSSDTSPWTQLAIGRRRRAAGRDFAV